MFEIFELSPRLFPNQKYCALMMLCFSGEVQMRFIVLITGLGMALSSLASTQTEKDCRDLYRLTDLAYAVETGRAIPKSESLPEHCKVRAVINRAIQVEVTMPAERSNSTNRIKVRKL